ncbi:hypothetical protein BLA29_000758 [Euroglyphus maynei]|uniref:Uncharacterized protein n=1 Tax=Euroglyphus maynei TaxID=6958 RepID=A0A1Y3AXL7_EURMA|nr:hypothetical protein BLA29_000758 [Euroglyphus maynei]
MNMVEGRHLSTSSSSVDDQTIECTLDNFQQCISGLWSSSGSNGSSDLAFPTTAEQLRLTCADLKKRVRCLDRHSEHCFTHQMMQVFGHIVTNAKQFVHDLCDDRKVQAEYLIHAKCFRNISLDEQKCAQEYRDAIALPANNRQRRQSQTKEMIMRRSCW